MKMVGYNFCSAANCGYKTLKDQKVSERREEDGYRQLFRFPSNIGRADGFLNRDSVPTIFHHDHPLDKVKLQEFVAKNGREWPFPADSEVFTYQAPQVSTHVFQQFTYKKSLQEQPISVRISSPYTLQCLPNEEELSPTTKVQCANLQPTDCLHVCLLPSQEHDYCVGHDLGWTEDFIRTVQTKPAIWDTRMKEHLNRPYIIRLWTEICEAVVPSWHELTLQEKTLRSKELQLRWRNIRTCYRREWNKQRRTTTDKSNIKRRKYIYFDQLSFLSPVVEASINGDEADPLQMYEDETSDSELVSDQEKIEHVYVSPGYKFPEENMDHEYCSLDYKLPEQAPVLVPTTSQASAHSSDTSLIPQNNYIDEDKTFLLSLVPSFKKMTDIQKLEAKIEFLTTIRRIRQKKPGDLTFSVNALRN